MAIRVWGLEDRFELGDFFFYFLVVKQFFQVNLVQVERDCYQVWMYLLELYLEFRCEVAQLNLNTLYEMKSFFIFCFVISEYILFEDFKERDGQLIVRVENFQFFDLILL